MKTAHHKLVTSSDEPHSANCWLLTWQLLSLLTELLERGNSFK